MSLAFFAIGGRDPPPRAQITRRSDPSVFLAGSEGLVLPGGEVQNCCCMGRAHFDFSGLTPEERLNLVEQIWDDLAGQPQLVPVTAAQKAELDRRLEAMQRDGGAGIPWEDVLRQIRTRAK